MSRVSPAIHTAEKAQGTEMRHSIAVASSWGPGREGSVETHSAGPPEARWDVLGQGQSWLAPL